MAKKQDTAKFKGEIYKIVVMHITKKTADGRPREARMVYDDETVDLEGGEEFMTVFVPAVLLKKKPIN